MLYTFSSLLFKKLKFCLKLILKHLFDSYYMNSKYLLRCASFRSMYDRDFATINF